jgi:tetratricopeptide (TPR) repeat protein
MAMLFHMKTCMISAWLAAIMALAASAAENPPAAPALPAVEEAIPGPVKALGKPAMMNFPGGIQMAVSTTSETAQAHVLQGLNHLHGGWEFEASRHFAAAMREDPECLLAHWGMVMSLLNPSPETGPARNAATDRMLDLVNQGKGSELERGYAYGLIKYIEEGPVGAATAFRKVADQFPNELQAGVFAALFNRGGYDATGDATPDQEAAEKSLLALIKKHPQSPVPLNALLLVRAEGLDLVNSLEMARALCQMVPDYPPYFHLLGHYEWRCGHHAEAAASFGRASSFFQRWMKENKAGIADCPEWVKAECYRIVSLVSRGDFETAYAAARQVAATPVPTTRPASPGARFLLWDAKTLPARILIHRNLRGNPEEASRSLPKPDEVRELRKHSLAYWWIDGLRFALEAQRLIDAGKIQEAREAAAALSQHGEGMAATQAAAAASGERSSWLRAFRALEVLASDVRGRIALAGPENQRGTAFNWFSSAADRQRPSPMLYPPMLLTPMASRLGEYHLKTQQPAEAVASFQRALLAFPNDMNSLVGLQRALLASGKPDQASVIGKRIEELKVR